MTNLNSGYLYMGAGKHFEYCSWTWGERCWWQKGMRKSPPHNPGPEEGTQLAVLSSYVPPTPAPSPPSSALVSACSLNRPWWEYLHHRNSKHHISGLFLFWKLVAQHLAARPWKKLSQVSNNHSTASMRLERLFYRSNLSRPSAELGGLLLQKSNLKCERDSTHAGCKVMMLWWV